jgi:hypothetical protein
VFLDLITYLLALLLVGAGAFPLMTLLIFGELVLLFELSVVIAVVAVVVVVVMAVVVVVVVVVVLPLLLPFLVLVVFLSVVICELDARLVALFIFISTRIK